MRVEIDLGRRPVPSRLKLPVNIQLSARNRPVADPKPNHECDESIVGHYR